MENVFVKKDYISLMINVGNATQGMCMYLKISHVEKSVELIKYIHPINVSALQVTL